VALVVLLKQFVLRAWKVGKWNPGIFRLVAILESNKILELMPDFAALQYLQDKNCRVLFGSDLEGLGSGMSQELRWIVVRLEEGHMKDRVKTQEVQREIKQISNLAICSNNQIRTKTAVIKFVGWVGGLDVATEEPHKLTRLECRFFKDVAVVVMGLRFLC
jgi:hypothetical protein